MEHACAVHFDRAHADTKLERNDFARPACNQRVKDLTLAPAEGRDPLRSHQFLADALTGVRECRVNGQEQCPIIDRPLYEVECAVLHRGHRGLDIARPTEHNRWKTNAQDSVWSKN